MNMSTIQVRKFGGKNVKGFIEFPTQNGRKTTRVEIIKRKVNNTYFYVREGIYGKVFDNFDQVKQAYVILRNVSEAEILKEIEA